MRVEKRRTVECGIRRQGLGVLFRCDAHADDEGVSVAGWAPHIQGDGEICKGKSPWFAIKLDYASTPWVFAKGQPQRVVMTLESLAQLAGLVLLADEARAFTTKTKNINS